MIVRIIKGQPRFDYDGYRRSVGINPPPMRAGDVVTLPIEELKKAPRRYHFSHPGEFLNSIQDLPALGLLVIDVEYDPRCLSYKGELADA